MKLFLKGSRCESPSAPSSGATSPPGHARLSPRQAERIRHPPAREAEAQALLRRPRAPVPPLFRAGLALAGEHRRSAAEHPGAPAGQRRPSARLRAVAGGGPPAGDATATSRSTARPATSPACWSRPATRSRSRIGRAACNWSSCNLQEQSAAGRPTSWNVIGTEPPEGRMSRLPTRGDVDPRIQDIREQLIIEFCSR